MAEKPRATGCSSSSGGGAETYSLNSPADEAEVAGVLFRLPDLIRKFESHRRFAPSWGAKRKRSVVDAPLVIEKLEFVSSSPTSPLAFSSHAGSNSKHVLPNKELSSTGFKKEYDEWLKDCGRSADAGQQFKAEVMKMEISDRLMIAENIKLQEARQQVNQSVCSISDSLEVQSLRRSQPLVHHHHHQPVGVGPTGIPDLNAPAAEEDGAGMEWPTELWDVDYQHHHQHRQYMAVESRAEAAALARQRRHLIQKSKKATRGNRY